MKRGRQSNKSQQNCKKHSNSSSANNVQPVPVTTSAGGGKKEKEKTQSVNTAFGTLRNLIPTEPADRKLSKIETLRLASSYITHLSHHLLHDETNSTNAPSDHRGVKICTFCLAETKKNMKHNCTSVSITPSPSSNSRMDTDVNNEYRPIGDFNNHPSTGTGTYHNVNTFYPPPSTSTLHHHPDNNNFHIHANANKSVNINGGVITANDYY